MPSLPFCRYRFTVRALEPLHLPAFAGSTLRGASGHALRQVVCLTRLPECGDCPLIATCPYPALFDTPALERHALQKFSHFPAPYVIEPPEAGARTINKGETFSFSMVLIGQALRQLPLITRAWERALEQGLTQRQSRCQLVEVRQERDDAPIQHPEEGIASPGAPAELAGIVGDTATLTFTSPLRLQRRGKLVSAEELDARTLLIALARRYQLLSDTQMPNPPQLDFPALADSASGIRLGTNMNWQDNTRYSNRQGRKLPLGGLVGRLNLKGNLTPFAQLLDAGQWLHIGKGAVFGLGHYHLE